MPPLFDSAPILAYFKDRQTAESCLRELRNSGLKNEQISVNYQGGVVLTPANDPAVYRATGQKNTGSDFQDSEKLDDVRLRNASQGPTPGTTDYDPESEARQYQQPDETVIVSIAAEPHQRQQIRELLHHYGARLADWSPDQVA